MREEVPIITEIKFKGKNSIDWNDVEDYLKRYQGKTIKVAETGDMIYISAKFPDEYAHSNDTIKLRGALTKVKANAAIIIEDIIKNASNRRWNENKKEKHLVEAIKGWYRYDVNFGMEVTDSQGDKRTNYYRGTAVVRITDKQLILYDIVNIKKEANNPERA